MVVLLADLVLLPIRELSLTTTVCATLQHPEGYRAMMLHVVVRSCHFWAGLRVVSLFWKFVYMVPSGEM